MTWLYVPGDRPDRFVKALASGADAIILDLEDAVAPARKDYARQAVAEFVKSTHDIPVSVRISDIDRDLEFTAGATGLRLPKVESAEQVRKVAGLTSAGLHPLVESALGLEAAFAIATATPTVAGISLGEADLRSDLGVIGDEGLLWARGRIVAAARAAGLPAPVMSVYPDLSDVDGLIASCRYGRRLGFLGRTAIHPKQLAGIVDGFRPEPGEVARSRDLLSALTEAGAQDGGTVVLPDGRFADRAMIVAARRTLELATRYSMR